MIAAEQNPIRASVATRNDSHSGNCKWLPAQILARTTDEVPRNPGRFATFLGVTAGWGSELTELMPLALVVALSPLSIIPAVLVLHTPRPKPTGLAFLVGWVVGLAALTAIFVEVSSLLGGLDKKPPWALWLRIVVGIALIVFGVFRWLTRKRSAHSPAWMRTITTVTPGRAAVIAAVLVVANPKVLFICAAAGLAIGSAGLGITGAWISVAFYVLVGASSVAIPVLATPWPVSGSTVRWPGSRTGWSDTTPRWWRSSWSSSDCCCCTRAFTACRSPVTRARPCDHLDPQGVRAAEATEAIVRQFR